MHRQRTGVSAPHNKRRHAVPASNETLKERLARNREIKITVIGRRSGKKISVPVWFVFEEDKSKKDKSKKDKSKKGTLYLLPVQGSDTQWYKNVLHNPSIWIDARGAEAEFRATPVTDPTVVKSVVEKFREKYGAKDVKKYYSKFDVAVIVPVD
jgi:hypothetical protein